MALKSHNGKVAVGGYYSKGGRKRNYKRKVCISRGGRWTGEGGSKKEPEPIGGKKALRAGWPSMCRGRKGDIGRGKNQECGREIESHSGEKEVGFRDLFWRGRKKRPSLSKNGRGKSKKNC